MCIEHWWNDIDSRNAKYSDNNQSRGHRVHTSHARRSQGLNSGSSSVSVRQLAACVVAQPGDDLGGGEDVHHV